MLALRHYLDIMVLQQSTATTMRSESLLICSCSAFDLDLRRPIKPRWPEFDRDLGGKPAGMPV